MGLVEATMADVNVVVEPLGETFVVRGIYKLEVSVSAIAINAKALFLKDAEQRFWGVCRELEAAVTAFQCVQANQHLGKRLDELDSKISVFKQALGKRSRRGIWTALGAMDSEDRSRIDYDLGRLRQNENELERGIQHESDVAIETYNLVNKSVTHLDRNMAELQDELNSIRQEVSKSLNYTSHVKTTVALESKLIEMTFWLNNLCQSLEQKLDAIVAVLYGKTNADLLEKLFPPHLLFKTMKDMEEKLEPGLSLPKNRDGHFLTHTWGQQKLRPRISLEDKLIVVIQLPIVSKNAYQAYRATIFPILINHTIWVSHIEEDVILQQKDSMWGYTLTSAEYSGCTHGQDVTVCRVVKGLDNFRNSRKCIVSIIFKQEAIGCQIRAIMSNHTIWLPTGSANTWRYLAPTPTNVTVLHNGNLSHISIQGNGMLEIQPNMTAWSERVKFEYFDYKEEIEIGLKLVSDRDRNISWAEVAGNLPSWHGHERVYTGVDMKKLFDLGVDIRDLKQDEPELKDLIYAPLESPWISLPMISAVCVLVLVVGCRSRFNCCARKTVIDPFMENVGSNGLRKNLHRRGVTKDQIVRISEDAVYETPRPDWVSGRQQCQIEMQCRAPMKVVSEFKKESIIPSQWKGQEAKVAETTLDEADVMRRIGAQYIR